VTIHPAFSSQVNIRILSKLFPDAPTRIKVYGCIVPLRFAGNPVV
jgi:hypothetical protein